MTRSSTLSQTDIALADSSGSTEPRSLDDRSTWHQTVHVVLPAYNEAEALEPLLEAMNRDLRQSGIDFTITVVDDGSSDQTALVASQASFRMPVQCVVHQRNAGLAAALRTGLTAALTQCRPGDVVVTMDADNTHLPGSIARMLSLVREGHDVVIASRYQSGARVIGVPVHRNMLSYGARWIFKLVFPIAGVRDYTCGYRMYRHELLARALDHYQSEFVSEQGFSCMVDVLLKLRPFRPVIGEVPIVLRYDQKEGLSKMRVTRTVLQTLALVFRRRFARPSIGRRPEPAEVTP